MTDEEFRALVLEAFKVQPTGDYHYPIAPNQLRHLVAKAVEEEREAGAELLGALRNMLTAVTFADPPKEFNGVLCHEARVPVGFVDAARAAIDKAEEVVS
jgi:hypothetical protein